MSKSKKKSRTAIDFPIAVQLGRDFHFFVCRRPFSSAWTFHQVVVSQYIQVPLNGSWSDAKFVDQLLRRHGTLFLDEQVDRLNARQHPVR
jgi:hypothetical protein